MFRTEEERIIWQEAYDEAFEAELELQMAEDPEDKEAAFVNARADARDIADAVLSDYRLERK